jgi:asparagine synthetase B (glutamine-hydrolysing)
VADRTTGELPPERCDDPRPARTEPPVAYKGGIFPDASLDEPIPASDTRPRVVAPRDAPVAAALHAADVLRATGRSAHLDPVAAWRLLAFGEYDVERSLLEDVLHVPLACRRALTHEGARDEFPAPAPRDVSYEEAVGLVREEIVRSVEDAVAPARRVAVLFSGGTDSSAVAAALKAAWARLGRDPADLGLVHFRSDDAVVGPEEPWAAETAKHLGLAFHAYGAGWPADPFAGEDEFLRLDDRPPDDGGFASGREELEGLRKRGYDAFLTGDGGGEVFAGWWMAEDASGGPVRRALRGAELAAREAVRRVRHAVTGDAGALRRKARACATPAWLVAARPAPGDAATYPAPRRGLRAGHERRERSAWCARQGVVLSFRHAWGEVLGLHVGVPLLDRRLLDLAVSFPPEHFLPDPRDRRLLRDAFADDLPRAAAARGKSAASAQSGLRTDLAAHGLAWMDRHVRGGALETAGLAPWRELEAWTRRAADGAPHDVYRAYAFAGLGAWCRSRGIP